MRVIVIETRETTAEDRRKAATWLDESIGAARPGCPDGWSAALEAVASFMPLARGDDDKASAAVDGLMEHGSDACWHAIQLAGLCLVAHHTDRLECLQWIVSVDGSTEALLAVAFCAATQAGCSLPFDPEDYMAEPSEQGLGDVVQLCARAMAALDLTPEDVRLLGTGTLETRTEEEARHG